MIYITGDTHSDFTRFNMRNFPEQKEMTKDDYVIICGDFGGIWYQSNDQKHLKGENHDLDELNNRNFTTLFVSGNHENFDRLLSDEFPTEIWNGGKVKKIRSSILMLMRGEMYQIENKKFFTFGGASSHDITDGILDINDPYLKDKIKKLKQQYKYCYRIKGLSWWEQELPSDEEITHSIETLEQHNWTCDYVITHCAPSSVQILLGYYDTDKLTKHLENIHQKLNYKHWFFGHYHDNKNVNSQTHLLYEQIIRIL